jgi:hypothetical protein
MTLRRVVVSASVIAVGVLGLSACSSDQPSGLAPFTPGASSTGPSPTSTSKWTPEQQQVIDGYDRFTDLQTAISTKALKVDMAKAHQVAKEPFATEYLKKLEGTLVAGFVQKGRVVNTVSAVTITGNTAILKTCVDQTHMSFSVPGNASAPPVGTRPPALATVTLARERDSWLVSGSKGGEGACVSG